MPPCGLLESSSFRAQDLSLSLRYYTDKSCTGSYIKWQEGMRSPRDRWWCTCSCWHAHKCASPWENSTFQVSWILDCFYPWALLPEGLAFLRLLSLNHKSYLGYFHADLRLSFWFAACTERIWVAVINKHSLMSVLIAVFTELWLKVCEPFKITAGQTPLGSKGGLQFPWISPAQQSRNFEPFIHRVASSQTQ